MQRCGGALNNIAISVSSEGLLQLFARETTLQDIDLETDWKREEQVRSRAYEFRCNAARCTDRFTPGMRPKSTCLFAKTGVRTKRLLPQSPKPGMSSDDTSEHAQSP
jgi:hypothetical protein